MDVTIISRIFSVFVIVATLLASPAFSDDNKNSRSYEELLEVYTNRSELLPEARTLESSLMAEAEELKPVDLWRSIQDFNKPARSRAANGLALVRKLFPGGDPGRWEEVSGFWLPQIISRPLAAFDAVYYTSIALLELDDEAAPWLAQELLEDLRGSSRASFLAIRTAPREYPGLVSRLESATGLTPSGGWPVPEITGKLPFAHAVSSFVTQDRAMISDMVFLNSVGHPVPGTGPFAWDRKKGRVYRVVESRDEIEWWLFR